MLHEAHADILLDIASKANLFRDNNGQTYADITIDGHRETWPLGSEGFKNWLRKEYFDSQRSALRSGTLNTGLSTLVAHAQRAVVRPVYLRAARYKDAIYIDLGDDSWRAIRISRAGWKIISTPPVRFIRRPGMHPLPKPRKGGNLKDLRPYMGGLLEEDFPILAGWICNALRGDGPYPLLAINGAQGSGKSTAITFLASLIDPSGGPLRPLPSDERALFAAGMRGLLQPFDNLSGISDTMSDSLCRMATGGTFLSRLPGSKEETEIQLRRPVILSGITSLFGKPDLVDRAFFVRFQSLDRSRTTEEDLQARFEKDRPRLFGAIIAALAEGLKQSDSVKFTKGARMADAIKFAIACETAFQPQGTFIQAHKAMLERVTSDLTESDPVAEALIALANEKAQFRGTATQLLNDLLDRVPEEMRGRKWPKSANALSNHLRRLASALRQSGLLVEFPKPEGHNRQRVMTITLTNKPTASKTSTRLPKPDKAAPPSLFDEEEQS